MYAQFFGNFLLSHELITTEQLLEAMELKKSKRLRFGTLAISLGYLSASEVEHIRILQTHQNRRFGELAVEIGLLSEVQVDEILALQIPDYLALGQALIDMNIIDNYELERLVADYISENEINELDYYDESRRKVDLLLNRYMSDKDGRSVSDYKSTFCTLLFNNLIRFIGDDYTPIRGEELFEYPTDFCVSQKIHGKYNITLYIDMSRETCIEFASRYVGENFNNFDEYVEASVMDFLNLHNGLFCVNESNSDDVELTLEPPVVETESLLIFDDAMSMLPVIYSFGTINFIFEVNS